MKTLRLRNEETMLGLRFSNENDFVAVLRLRGEAHWWDRWVERPELDLLILAAIDPDHTVIIFPARCDQVAVFDLIFASDQNTVVGIDHRPHSFGHGFADLQENVIGSVVVFNQPWLIDIRGLSKLCRTGWYPITHSKLFVSDDLRCGESLCQIGPESIWRPACAVDDPFGVDPNMPQPGLELIARKVSAG